MCPHGTCRCGEIDGYFFFQDHGRSPPDFLYAALDTTGCAAFIKENRTKFVNANQVHRKSGYRPAYLIMAIALGERVDGNWLVTGRREKWRAIVGLGAGRSGATESPPALSAGAAAGACRARRRTGRRAAAREFR
jgi:hypothetical protein